MIANAELASTVLVRYRQELLLLMYQIAEKWTEGRACVVLAQLSSIDDVFIARQLSNEDIRFLSTCTVKGAWTWRSFGMLLEKMLCSKH
ncbi:hypothetical protein M9H77_11251 [Catharanthus roseus]|uniref:Uncharacterized protein n=1 Tax=Catharanthus roseus TaxID=4058 RepID=A0ACC0BE70_CATRO|nr:hypothetical protein M9H77_11251 [Catharanthus roseus]